MKRRFLLSPILAMLWLPLHSLSASGIPVVDVAQIAANKVSWATDLAQQVLQEANQQTQIAKQLEQIQQLYTQIDQLTTQIEQVDDYLDRFGDPETILNLAGLTELQNQLGQATDHLDVAENLGIIDGVKMFTFDGQGVFEAIKPDISIDGEVFAREAERYKPEDAVRETVDQFRAKKLEVIERRDVIKGEISNAVEAMRTATTDSEVKKLTGVLIGLQTELEAVDRELDIAANENAARALENENQQRLESKAQAEAHARRFEVGNARDVSMYQLDQSRYGW